MIESIIVGYIVNFVLLVIFLVYSAHRLIKEENMIILDGITPGKSKVKSGMIFPYGVILEMILIFIEYRKFRKTGAKTYSEFILYMMT